MDPHSRDSIGQSQTGVSVQNFRSSVSPNKQMLQPHYNERQNSNLQRGLASEFIKVNIYVQGFMAESYLSAKIPWRCKVSVLLDSED